MTAVSPRNPNLCLSCEQLADDDSAELERLLSAAEQAGSSGQPAAGLVVDEFSPGAAEHAHPSDTMGCEHLTFSAPA